MDDGNSAIIIDNGSGYIKAGIAGDDAPKSIFPTLIGRPKHPGMMVGMDQKDIYIGHEVSSKEGVLSMSSPIKNGVIENWEDMEKMWHHCFYNELQISPEDNQILLTEAPCNSKKNRETIMQMMFEKFQVSSFYLASQQVLSLYASGRTTGIVIDSGYSVTSTVPVYEGFALSHAIYKMNLAGKDLTEYLMKLMGEDGVEFSNIEETARENARDTKEKKCYIAIDFEGSMKEFAEGTNKSVTHKLPDGNIISLRNQVFRCPEALFQPNKIIGKEIQGIHEGTFNSILKCDSDIRKDLYGNIVISGGTAMFRSNNSPYHRH